MPAEATVIIPTYGSAPFLRPVIESARKQTLTDLEICIICDGSPPEMIEMINGLASKDSRIKVFVNEKAPRTGEIHRPAVIEQTSAPIICYLCHDDLWFPNHVATMKRLLQTADFAHSMHHYAGLAKERFMPRTFLYADLENPGFRFEMLNPKKPMNYFGLTFGAHSRKAYLRLEEGWTTTPEGVWTDLHMWRKFLKAPWCRCVSHLSVTAAHFQKDYWVNLMSPEEFEIELDQYVARMDDPGFLQDLNSAALSQLVSQKQDQNAFQIREVLREFLEKPEMCVSRAAMREVLNEPEMCASKTALRDVLNEPEMCASKTALRDVLNEPEMCASKNALRDVLNEPEMCASKTALRETLWTAPCNDFLTRRWQGLKRRVRRVLGRKTD